MNREQFEELLEQAAIFFQSSKYEVVYAAPNGKFYREKDLYRAEAQFGEHSLVRIDRHEALAFIEDALYF